MKIKLIAIAALAPLLILAAESLHPMNAKTGLWEMTTSNSISGAPPIAPEVLARMTPEQRAQMEALFKQRAGQGAAPMTTRTCVTQEKLSNSPFTENRKSCTRTILNSTASTLQFHEECTETDGSKRIADGKFEVSGTTSMKGSIQAKAVTKEGRPLNVNIDMNGKWLSADCGSTK